MASTSEQKVSIVAKSTGKEYDIVGVYQTVTKAYKAAENEGWRVIEMRYQRKRVYLNKQRNELHAISARAIKQTAEEKRTRRLMKINDFIRIAFKGTDIYPVIKVEERSIEKEDYRMTFD